MRYGSGSGIFRPDKKRFSRTGRRRFDGSLRKEVPLLVPDFFSVRLSMIRPEKSGAGSVAVNEAEGDLGEGQNDDDDLMIEEIVLFLSRLLGLEPVSSSFFYVTYVPQIMVSVEAFGAEQTLNYKALIVYPFGNSARW